MFFKVSVASCFLGVLCLLSFGSNETNAQNFELAKTGLGILLQIFEQIVNPIRASFDQDLNQVINQALMLENMAKSKLDSLLDPLKMLKESVVTQSQNAGIIISRCQIFIEQFNYLPEKVEYDLHQCVEAQVVKAQLYVDDVKNNITDILKNANSTITQAIDKCDADNECEANKCILNVFWKDLEYYRNVPMQLTELGAKTAEQIKSVVPVFRLCRANALFTVGNASRIVSDLANCLGETGNVNL